MISYLAGDESDHLELGIGLMPVLSPGMGDTKVIGTATLGYRYQPREGGTIFRIGFTPLYFFDHFFPWLGISVGTDF